MSVDMMIRECQSCGRRRADGWVLVEGLCRSCGLESFRRRSEKLLAQAKRLLAAEARG